MRRREIPPPPPRPYVEPFGGAVLGRAVERCVTFGSGLVFGLAILVATALLWREIGTAYWPFPSLLAGLAIFGVHQTRLPDSLRGPVMLGFEYAMALGAFALLLDAFMHR